MDRGEEDTIIINILKHFFYLIMTFKYKVYIFSYDFINKITQIILLLV